MMIGSFSLFILPRLLIVLGVYTHLSQSFDKDIDSSSKEITLSNLKFYNINRNHNDKKHSDLPIREKGSAESLFTTKSKSCCDPNLFEELNKVLIDFPIDLNKIIVDYSYYGDNEKSRRELYKKVIDRLNVIFEKNENNTKDNPKFCSKTFANDLYDILSKNNINIPNNDSFYYDLTRLLFKWLIYMKQSSNNKNVKKFKKISYSAKKLIFLINKSFERVSLDAFNFDFKANSMDGYFEELINCELAEVPDIFPLFKLVLSEFYSKKINCLDLKNKYFKGDFNNNILLRSMIHIYSPVSLNSIGECLLEKDYPDKFNYDPSLFINSYDIKAFESMKDINLGIYRMKFLNEHIIKFFLNTNKKFKIRERHYDELIALLQKLEDANLLTLKPLDQIIKFSINNNINEGRNASWSWSREKYIGYINYEKSRKRGLSEEDYIKYLKLVDSGDGELDENKTTHCMPLNQENK